MAATVLHPFSECTGIEILEGLHALALDLLVTFDDKVRPKMGRSTHTGTYVGVNVGCACAYLCVCVCVGVCVCICIRVCMFVSASVCERMDGCKYVCTCEYMCVCMSSNKVNNWCVHTWRNRKMLGSPSLVISVSVHVSARMHSC